MGGCLYADAIASHRAAGVLWRLPGIEQALELTIPRGQRVAMKGFEVHRTSFFEPMDLAHKSRIPVTSLPRTVIDVSLEVPSLGPALIDHVAEIQVRNPTRLTASMARIIAAVEARRR